jgi:hypothetical protein
MRVALLPLLILACSDGRPRPVDRPTLESIAVSPANVTLEPGETRAFTAEGTYSDGMTGDVSEMVTWSSTDDAVATIAAGVVTAVGPGNVKIEAALGDKTGSATVIVMPEAELVVFTLQPTTASIAIGGTIQISALARYSDMSSMDVTGAVEWTTTDGAIATVEGGLVTGVSAGSVSVSARDPITGTSAFEPVDITVLSDAPASITVGPAMVQLPVGSTQQFTAIANFEDGTSVDFTTTAIWSSSNPTFASIDAGGVATALADGITSVTAEHPSGMRASVTLRVVPAALLTLAVNPPTAMIGMGDRIDFEASGLFTDGSTRDLTNAVTWGSTDTAVATISNDPGSHGTVTTVGPGSTTITAFDQESGIGSEDSQSSATLEVSAATLESIIVLPAQISIALGSDQQFQAIGIYSDNSSQDLTSTVTWSSSDLAVATVDTNGLAASVAQGTTVISALDPISGISSDDADQSAELTVEPPAIIAIEVTPPTRAMIVGGTQQFTATGYFSNGTSQVITQSVTWESDGPAVSIAANGLATALAQGTAVISAIDPATGVSSDASNQSANVTVSIAALVSIAVTPTSTTVPVGADVPYRAMGNYANGATQDLTHIVTWASTNQTAVRISNAGGSRGVATALAAGNAMISATEPSSGITSNSAAITAAAVALTAIAVRPQNATVDVGETIAFSALGTFAGGARYPITSSVMWSSSNTVFASISNVEGSRGVATGVATGNVTITAQHVAAGLSGTASLLVELGIIMVSRSWNGPTQTIDGTNDYEINVGMVDFTAADFPGGATIIDVDVSIDFLKTDGTCASPGTGAAYHGETNFRLQSGTGSRVVLASPGTWSGDVVIQPVTVTFDQSAMAAPVGTPVSGTFLPYGGNLDSYDGQSPIGAWILQAGDTAGSDPLCVISYTVTITAQ